MSNVLASPDLDALRERNYSLSRIEDYLVVNDIYYLDGARKLQKATLAAPLNLRTPTTLGAPVNHQMYWSGGNPYQLDGTPIPQLANITANITLNGVLYTRHLSNKPPEGFLTYLDLVEHYVSLLCAPASELYGVNPRTGAVYAVPESSSPFKFGDSFSARAELVDLNQLLGKDRVAVIGLGGTGSYVLDFLVKTPVYSIDAFDFDTFDVHNGFRSPGEVPSDYFGRPKVDVYNAKYQPFRHRLNFRQKRVAAGDDALFDSIDFAFVCVDDGVARNEIWAMLLARNIPFVDTGMGVDKDSGALDGLIRTSFVSPELESKARNEVTFDAAQGAGAYRVLVQIAELNALNAALAVMRYKQWRGFYADEVSSFNSLIAIAPSKWVRES